MMTARRGSVLLYAAWAVVLLSMFVAGIASQAMFSIGFTDRLAEQLRAAYLARGALHYAQLALEEDESKSVDGMTDFWANNPAWFQSRPLGGGTVEITAPRPAGYPVLYGLADEEQRLSLNAAPVDVLQRFLEFGGGLGEDEAVQLAAAIQDWRDEDTKRSPSGAEGLYYRSLREPYNPKDGPFEVLEELLLVRGMTVALYQRLEPYLTVYGSGRLNLNTAHPVLLYALGLSDAGVEGVTLFRSGEDGLEGTIDDRLVLSVSSLEDELGLFVPAEDLIRLRKLANAEVLGVAATDFRMSIRAESSGALSRIQVSCVIDREGTIKLWEER